MFDNYADYMYSLLTAPFEAGKKGIEPVLSFL